MDQKRVEETCPLPICSLWKGRMCSKIIHQNDIDHPRGCDFRNRFCSAKSYLGNLNMFRVFFKDTDIQKKHISGKSNYTWPSLSCTSKCSFYTSLCWMSRDVQPSCNSVNDETCGTIIKLMPYLFGKCVVAAASCERVDETKNGHWMWPPKLIIWHNYEYAIVIDFG